MIILNTVNVIELVDGAVIGLHAYVDTHEGNKEAEKRFCDIAKENGFINPLESYLDDGYVEIGNFEIMLVHSTP